MSQKPFPTSEDLYNRIKTDSRISSCHVSIVYFDSILNKYIDKRFSSWKEISHGGDIPWHRVYYFKYKDKIVWDRQKKECFIDSIITSTSNNLPESFKIISYNILNDDANSIKIRKDQLINYILSTNADIICLQEVSDQVLEVLKELNTDESDLQDYEMAITDLKINNIVLLSKASIYDVKLIDLNNISKQALKIVVHDHNDIEVQLFGIHLTSDHQNQSDSKRKEQLSIIKSNININYPAFIIGDTNIEADAIPELEEFVDSAILVNDRTDTYNPSINKLAFINCKTKTPKRYDRILFNRSYNISTYRVRNEIMFSDHFPVECTVNPSISTIKVIGEHRKTSLMLIIKNDEVDRIRKRLFFESSENRSKTSEQARYPSHLNIFYGFIERDEFDQAYYRIRDMVCQKYLGSSLVFDSIDVLELEKHRVVCLLPCKETKDLLISMRNEIGDILNLNKSNFTPHISLGKLEKLNNDNDDDTDLRAIKAIKLQHKMCLEELYFCEYKADSFSTIINENNNFYVEPIMVIKKQQSINKQFIVNILEKTLKEKIVIGGSSIFDMNDSNDDNNYDISDLDLVIYIQNILDDIEFFKNVKKCLAFTGYFFDIELVTNQYSTYLKMGYCPEIGVNNINIDLHFCTTNKESDIITASKYVYDLIDKMNRITDFKKSLRIIKDRFKKLGIYGQTFGYLNGINILIMLGFLYKNQIDVNHENVINRFYKLFLTWEYPKSLELNDKITFSDNKSKASMIMRIPNVVSPYDNTVRNITKSTFNATMKALSNSLDSNVWSDKYELFVGIKCNALYKFNAMRKFIEANILNIILSYEDLGFSVRPVSKWIIKVNQVNTYLYEGYLTFGLNETSSLCNKLSQLEQSIALIYPDQIFRFKVLKK